MPAGIEPTEFVRPEARARVPIIQRGMEHYIPVNVPFASFPESDYPNVRQIGESAISFTLNTDNGFGFVEYDLKDRILVTSTILLSVGLTPSERGSKKWFASAEAYEPLGAKDIELASRGLKKYFEYSAVRLRGRQDNS